MIYTGDDGISCRVVLLDDEEAAEQEKTATSSDGKFLIKAVPASMLKEDDQKQPPDSTLTIRHDLIFERETFGCIIRGILVDLDLPAQELLIGHIFCQVAKKIETQSFGLNKKVLYFLVHVEQESESESESESDDDYYEELEPAKESVIDALGKLKIESGNGNGRCTICLEELVIGVEATQMACSHLYHNDCIRSWLQINGVCPLCRDHIA
ncbi:uncharacterized protein LOC126667789 [Mercurialis annua]|uniref:uncharacterized protein LOC126667789 n=1 Tax=Mercurialis annua TaxID=3986 RepID=UPI00215F94BE|nr:uncharacterized protein LOC126667789 [Mercurialis annua]